MNGFLLRLKADLLNSAMSLSYLGVALLFVYAREDRPRLLLMAVVAVVSFVVWLAAGHRFRLVADTPTSRIASAPQGYVELVGLSDLHPGSMGLGLASMPPSVWYRYVVHRRTADGKWRRVDSGRSEETFLLRDDSGTCVVDPDDAEVLSSHRRVYHMGEHRHTVEYLSPGETLYVLGEMVTVGGAASPLNKSEDVRQLLAEWKRAPRQTLARFDFNGDGQLDMAEWDQARLAAEKEVQKLHEEIRRQPGTHILRAPEDGRPFILANRDPEKLMRRLRWWSWFHLTVSVAAAVTALVWVGRIAL